MNAVEQVVVVDLVAKTSPVENAMRTVQTTSILDEMLGQD